MAPGFRPSTSYMCRRQDYELLDYMPCDEIPFAKIEVDPEPHSFFGRSLVSICMDDQDNFYRCIAWHIR